MSDQALQGVPNFDKLEVIKTGTTTIVSSASAGTYTAGVTIPAGFTPIVIASVATSTFSTPIPYTQPCTISGAGDGKICQNFRWYIIGTTLTFVHEITAAGITDTGYSSGNIPVTYYILRQKVKT